MFAKRKFNILHICVCGVLLGGLVIGCAQAVTPVPAIQPPVPTLAPAPTQKPPTVAPTQSPPPTVAPTIPPTSAPTIAPKVAPTAVPTAVPSAGAPTLKPTNSVNGGFVTNFGWSSNNQVMTAQMQDSLTQYNVSDLKPMNVVSTTFATQVYALSPDGTKVAGMAQDKSIQIWNAADGKSLVTLQGAVQPIGASFTPDDSMIGLGSAEKIEITLYEVSTGKPLKTLSGFQTAAPVFAGVFAPDNKTMAWVSRGTVQFMDIESGKLGAELQFEDFVGAAAFTPDSKLFVTSSAGTVDGKEVGLIQVWNVADGKAQSQQLTTPEFFSGLSVSPTGTYLATATGNTLLSWDWKGGGDAKSVNSPGQISQLDFSNDGKMLATGDQDGNISVWTVQ